MKHTILITVLGAALSLTGCSELVSLNSVTSEGEARLDPALPGVWQGTDALFVIRRDAPGYRIVYAGKDSAKTFRGVLFQAGDAELLDVTSEDEDPFQVPVHVVVRVWPEPSKLRWAFLDTDWLKQQARQALPTQLAGDRTLLTAPSPAVRAFVTRYGADDKAHKEVTVLEKVQ